MITAGQITTRILVSTSFCSTTLVSEGVMELDTVVLAKEVEKSRMFRESLDV